MTALSKAGRELELKLAVSDSALDTILGTATPRETPVPPLHRHHEVTTYFDTGDHLPARHGVAGDPGAVIHNLVISLAARAEQGRSSGGDVLGDAALARPIKELCPPLLDRLARKVERRGQHIKRRSDAQRHALRKALKKLRYGIEYVADVYPRQTTKPYVRTCKKMQKVLGDANDTATATDLADRLTGPSGPQMAPALGALATQLEHRRGEALRQLPQRWQAFRTQARFWS